LRIQHELSGTRSRNDRGRECLIAQLREQNRRAEDSGVALDTLAPFLSAVMAQNWPPARTCSPAAFEPCVNTTRRDVALCSTSSSSQSAGRWPVCSRRCSRRTLTDLGRNSGLARGRGPRLLAGDVGAWQGRNRGPAAVGVRRREPAIRMSADPVDHLAKAFGSKFHATSRATSHGESGYLAVIHGQPPSRDSRVRNDITAGQRRSDLR
jgi:hypothetical protein